MSEFKTTTRTPVVLSRRVKLACPVCAGRGWVQPGFRNGFVGGTHISEPCPECEGRRVYWTDQEVTA